jgi:EAL domain-containing protein (putative c-di-GMP-specific phosphodiesterase class I)
LKIDRSFVNCISQNSENKEIVRTIVVLAQNLGMGVIAEGVETMEQLSLLRELNCEYGQGYLFSRPLDTESAANLIAKMSKTQSVIPGLEGVFEMDAFEPLASSYSM